MFGERIKELRKERGLSQEELGNVFSISGPAVSKWESGISEPDNATLLKLSNFFGVSVDFLLGNTTKKKDKEEIELLRQLLIKKGYMGNDDYLTNEELEKLLNFIKINKDFFKDK